MLTFLIANYLLTNLPEVQALLYQTEPFTLHFGNRWEYKIVICCWFNKKHNTPMDKSNWGALQKTQLCVLPQVLQLPSTNLVPYQLTYSLITVWKSTACDLPTRKIYIDLFRFIFLVES